MTSPSASHVLAIVVTAGTTPYLPDTLHALTQQTLPPAFTLIVDVASRGNGLGSGEPVETAVELSGLDDVSDVKIIRAPSAGNFGQAVGYALHTCPNYGPSEPKNAGHSSSRWLWLLHDDSAPEPSCLAALLDEVITSPSVAVAGPKQIDFYDPDVVLDVGIRVTPAARRANSIVPGEIDQGQYDHRSDVIAVGSAGSLINREVFDSIGGFNPDFGPYGDGLELCRVIRMAGHRVIVVPRAKIRHRRASMLNLRPRGDDLVTSETQQPIHEYAVADVDASFADRRTSQLRNWMIGAPTWQMPLIPLIVFLGALLRGAWRLTAGDLQLARAELTSAYQAVIRPGIVARGRGRIRANAAISRRVLSQLYMNSAEIRAARADRRRQRRESHARATAPSELELSELKVQAQQRRLTVAVVLIILSIAGFWATADLITASTVGGGALVRMTMGVQQAWAQAQQSWIMSGNGYPSVITPLLTLTALVTTVLAPLGISVDDAVQTLLIIAIPLAGWGGWVAAGTLSRRVSLRSAAAFFWAAAPSFLLSLGQGRLSALIIHLLLPWLIVGYARATAKDRRDIVLSGLVGVDHAQENHDHASGDQDSRDQDQQADDEAADDHHADVTESTDVTDSTDVIESANVTDSTDAVVAPEFLDDDDLDEWDWGDDDELIAINSSTESDEDIDNTMKARRAAALRAAVGVEHCGPGSVSALAATALLAAVLVAIAPMLAVPLVLLLIVLTATRRHSLGQALVLLIPSLLVIAPVGWAVSRDIHGQSLASIHTWKYALAQAAGLPDLPLPFSPPHLTDLFAFLPVAHGDLTSASYPIRAVVMAVGALAIGFFWIAALAGGFAGGMRGARARQGMSLALLSLLTAAFASTIPVAIGHNLISGQPEIVMAWTAPLLSLAYAGLLTSAIVASDVIRDWVDYKPLKTWHLPIYALTACAVLLPLVMTGGWVWSVSTVPDASNTEESNAAPSLTGGMTRAEASPPSDSAPSPTWWALQPGSESIPVIAAHMQNSPEHSLVLALTPYSTSITFAQWRGQGVELVDVLPSISAYTLHSWLPDHQDGAGTMALNPTDPSDRHLSQSVSTLLAVQDDDAAANLASHGIGVLLVSGADHSTQAEVRASIAATSGMEQLATTASGESWRVGGTIPASFASLRTNGTDGAGTVVLDTSPSGVVDMTIEQASATRTLHLAQRASIHWKATLNGEPLASVSADDGWSQEFLVPPHEGHLKVWYETTWSTWLLYAGWAVMALYAFIALPVRSTRRRGL
ncbi:glycosyltransferase family 2 protein [Actinomyces vulturis]|uniref:glycosyltransferase family 2 protein n=1 Tax=Actinomyces vulturis TaxID=1857645 RepID=UPI0008298E2B|nr:glycosyltransferase [Actinomyces vulturis]